jgi:glycosyltransferase involved in cell wall biosynthesis
LSFVIPVFNESENIDSFLDILNIVAQGIGLTYEIIIVDDGSTDSTRKRVIKHAKDNCCEKVLILERNEGKGCAIRTGFEYAIGDTIIFVDSDLDINPRCISSYVEATKRGDIVIASKRHPESNVKAPPIRLILSRIFNMLTRLLTGIKTKDTQTGLKALRKKAFRNIFPRLAVKRYAFDVELLVLAHLCGLRVVELPVDIVLDDCFSPIEAWKMLLDLLGIAYRLRISNWYKKGLGLSLK